MINKVKRRLEGGQARVLSGETPGVIEICAFGNPHLPSLV